MKLSHESKRRLGIGIGAFVLIIGLVVGTSRTLIHFDDGGISTMLYPACLVRTMRLTRTMFWMTVFTPLVSKAFE